MGSPEAMLLDLIYLEDHEAVKALLKSKVNINYQNSGGITPLLGATEKGDYKMSKLLLDHGADVNGRGRLNNVEWRLTNVEYSFGIPHQERVLEWTPLINAALYGHADIIQLLIEYGADINFRDIHGRSALYTALQLGKEKCAEILIRNGAEVSPIDIDAAVAIGPNFDIRKLMKECKAKKIEIKNKNLPFLHPAALDGDRERLRELIKIGADINLQDKSGNTALHIALENGYLGCAELLIKKGADVNINGKNKSTALHLAASLGINKIIPLLIENGAVVDARGDDNITPLHFAVFHSFPMCVKQLLDYGADVNTTFADGKTALHVAVPKSADCIELLIRKKADIFAKDDMGVCPLELAIELGLETFRKLLPGKYNISSVDGTTPLHIASRCCKTDCLRVMIQDGCDVNVTTKSGDTPLHFACTGGGIVSSVLHGPSDVVDTENVKLLLKAGAKIDKKNHMGLCPVHVCAKNGSITPLITLYRFGAKIDLPGGKKRQTPLHFAAEEGSLMCAKFLIENGADKMALNSENFTALMLAARNSHFSCVKFLLQNDVPLFVS